MINILALALIITFVVIANSYIIIGAFNAAHDQDGEGRKFILNPVYEFSVNVLGPYWSKPVLGCYKCMASLWGGVPAFFFLVYKNFLELGFIECLGSSLLFAFLYTCLLSGVATSIYDRIRFHDWTARKKWQDFKSKEEFDKTSREISEWVDNYTYSITGENPQTTSDASETTLED